MERKTAIVTGANSGMGLVAATALAKKRIHVIMASRSKERGKEALLKVMDKSQSEHVDLMQCDLGSLASIRSFAANVKEKYKCLDILINNAGVVSLKRELTTDLFESQIGINHLGHFLLTNLILPELRNSEDARVINISSGAHKWGRIHFRDPHLSENYNVVKGYGQSKLANVLFTKALAEKVSSEFIAVNAVHPGAVATNLGIDRTSGFGKTVTNWLAPWFKSPEQGAETAVYLALDPEIKGVTGGYFYNKKPASISKKASDRKLAETLWIWSEREVGITSLS
ncbi:SDR family oxidoreductase [Halobacillus sp. A5]|uniref:SDR family oxidoreductase n=1 Tax=Halobacillus sp. A5 TaxID=2880263 RepID=UPI0020A66270|nr:SDR family oxidoreductase [Halobacillus sp. A5]MCP3026835.1 SDR family oxidoreductase [Halobacillus sp. A5]